MVDATRKRRASATLVGTSNKRESFRIMFMTVSDRIELREQGSSKHEVTAKSTYTIAVHDVAGRTAAVQPPDTPCTAPVPDPDWFDASDPAKVWRSCFHMPFIVTSSSVMLRAYAMFKHKPQCGLQVLAVKAALRASREAHDQLPLCREREIAQLQPWLRERLQTGHGGFSYVAGTPGIGEHHLTFTI